MSLLATFVPRACVRWALLALLGVARIGSAEPAEAALQGEIDRLARAHRICGVAVAVLRHGEPGAMYSASACAPALRVTAQSTFQAASLGKPVFAYAVLKLVEEGKLGLDEPLVHYLPDGYVHQQSPYAASLTVDAARAQDARLERVTARMALTHTAGLPNASADPLTFSADPGVAWRYSGAGYTLLQRAVEAVAGQPLDRVVASRVFGPARMQRSGYVWNESIAETFVPAFAASGEPSGSKPFTAPIAASSLYTSAQDYARFLALVLADPVVLAQVAAPSVEVDAGLRLSWGPGWGIEAGADERFLWQWGSNPGYRAFAVASVTTGDGFVMLTDSDEGLALVAPIGARVVPGARGMFRFRMLAPSFACKTFGRCT